MGLELARSTSDGMCQVLQPNKGGVLRCFWMELHLAHFLVALSLLCVAVVEFSAEAPLFDVLLGRIARRCHSSCSRSVHVLPLY